MPAPTTRREVSTDRLQSTLLAGEFPALSSLRFQHLETVSAMFHEITFAWTNNATANFTGVALPSFQMDFAHFLLTRGPYGCACFSFGRRPTQTCALTW